MRISCNRMLDDEGLQYMVEACKKLELKHLEQYKLYCEHNSRQFTYGQNSSRYDVLIHLNSNNGGSIEDKRSSADCDLYKNVEKLIRTIVTDYNIDLMSSNLEQLKERFNYKNALDTGITRPIVTSFTSSNVKVTANSPSINDKSTSKPEKSKKEKLTGLSGLARILKMNEDSDEEENDNNDSKDDETKNMSRVDEIIYKLQKMNITSSVLQSMNAPKSVSQSKIQGANEIQPINDPTLVSGIDTSMNNNMIPGMNQNNFMPPFPQLQLDPSMMSTGMNTGMVQNNIPVMPNSLYTLPAQI